MFASLIQTHPSQPTKQKRLPKKIREMSRQMTSMHKRRLHFCNRSAEVKANLAYIIHCLWCCNETRFCMGKWKANGLFTIYEEIRKNIQHSLCTVSIYYYQIYYRFMQYKIWMCANSSIRDHGLLSELNVLSRKTNERWQKSRKIGGVWSVIIIFRAIWLQCQIIRINTFVI